MTAVTDTSNTSVDLAKAVTTLPPLPATAQQILTCFGDEFIDVERVAAVVEGDAGICAKLLGLAAGCQTPAARSGSGSCPGRPEIMRR